METRKISISLHENESYIRKRCENCDDILIRPMRLGEGHKADCLMVYIEVAVSNMMLDDSAIGKMINHFWEIPEEKIREFIRRNSLGIADVKELSSMEEVFGAILSGNAVFFLDGYDKAMKISSKGYPGLAVSEVKTEKVLRGSKEGFCDSVKTNAALVRKRIRDTRLKVEQSSIGVRSNTVVQLLYVEDLVHEELLTAVKERLESFTVDGILDSGMLEQLTEEESKCLAYLKDAFSVKVNNKDGNLKITLDLPDPKLSAYLTNRAQAMLQTYIARFRIAKAQAALDFAEERYTEVKNELEKKQQALVQFRDKHPDRTSVQLETEEKILTNDYELFFGLYSDIVKQREKAKIQVKEDMPVLTVIEPVVEPTVPSKPQRALIVLASLLLGLFVGCGFVLIQPIFSQIVSSKKQAHTIPIKRMKKIS